MEEQDVLIKRRDALITEIQAKITETGTWGDCLARRITRVRILLWTCVTLNFLVGVFSPWICSKALPPIFTLLSGGMGASYFFLSHMTWRVKSQAFYACRDNLERQISRLTFQQHAPTPDSIAAVARERDNVLSLLGQRLGKATLAEDQQVAKHTDKGS